MHLSLVFSFSFPFALRLRSASPLRFVRLALLRLSRSFGSLRSAPDHHPTVSTLGVFLSFFSWWWCPSPALVRSAPAGRCPAPSAKLRGAGHRPAVLRFVHLSAPWRVWGFHPPAPQGGRPLRVFCQQNKKGRLPRTYLLCCCVKSLRTRSRSLPTQ